MLGWFRKKKNVSLAPPDWMMAAQYAARCRWISHVCDFAGDPTDEWTPNPGMELPHRPEFMVLEFAPKQDRDHWTYMSAGLSLAPQAGDAEMPHVEVTAYSCVRDARLAEFLFMLSHDIATRDVSEPEFKAYDLWGADCYGLLNFMLVPAREPVQLLNFPNRALRPEDERYLLATTGKLEGSMKLDLLQLVPLTHEEWEQASHNRSTEFLDSINWGDQPKTYGWSRIEPANQAR